MKAKLAMKIAIAVFAVIVCGGIAAKAMIIPAIAPNEAEPKDAATTENEQTTESLSDEELRRAQSYSGATLELAETLESSVWSDGSGNTVRFGRGYYTIEKKDGSKDTGKALLGEIRASTGVVSDGTASIKTCALDTDSGPAIIVYSVSSGASKSSDKQVITSKMFGTDREFERTDPSREITVEKPSDEILGLIGGAEGFDGVATEIADYVSLRYPSANSAKWDSTAKIDYENKSVDLKYMLDDRAASNITVKAFFEGGATVGA